MGICDEKIRNLIALTNDAGVMTALANGESTLVTADLNSANISSVTHSGATPRFAAIGRRRLLR